MMVIDKKESFVEVVTDKDMEDKIMEFLGNRTEDNWISVSKEDDVYKFGIKPKDGDVSKLEKFLNRRLH